MTKRSGASRAKGAPARAQVKPHKAAKPAEAPLLPNVSYCRIIEAADTWRKGHELADRAKVYRPTALVYLQRAAARGWLDTRQAEAATPEYRSTRVGRDRVALARRLGA